MQNLNEYIMSVGLLCSSTMLLAWLWALKIKNISLVDCVWAGLFFPVVWLTAHPNYNLRSLLLGGVVSLWSLRLCWHLCKRVYKEHPKEDSRYINLRLKWGGAEKQSLSFKVKTFIFFQVQALLVVILSGPFYLILRNTSATLHVLEVVGFLFSLVALLLEGLSDAQLKNFKTASGSKKEVCNVGFWAYSRHPNYFFEWMYWVGLFIFSLGTSGAFVSVYAPALMLLLLLKVSGVPWAEMQSLKSRGEKFVQYQKKTSIFVPWFPKQ